MSPAPLSAPIQEWWSAAELAAAGLPEVPSTRRGVNAAARDLGWAARPDQVRARAGARGGQEYHWSLLPLAAKRALLAGITDTRDEQEARGALWAAFEALPESAKARARDRHAAVVEVDGLVQAGLERSVAVREVAQSRGLGERTLWSWLAMSGEQGREDWLALVAPKPRGPAPTGPAAPAAADGETFMGVLKSLFLRPERPTFKQCHRQAAQLARRRGWEVPSYETARRRYLREVPRQVEVFAQQGAAGLERFYPAQIRDRSALVAMEAVNADCHKIDVFVRW
ncbi:MAG: DNA-binding domain-containing protein, partial [Shimia sp.]